MIRAQTRPTPWSLQSSYDGPVWLHWPIFGDLGTPAGVAAAINAAADYVALQATNKEICIPAGTFTVAATALMVAGDPVANDEEGYTIMLTGDHSGLVWRGRGRTLTKFVPLTNTIEMFVGLGADDLRFHDIGFNNIANGVLQDEAKPLTKTPGAGIAGLGNACNAAIRQYLGAGLIVDACKFNDFHTAVGAVGDHTDDQVLSGDVIVRGQLADGCVFGLLAEQPETIRYENSDYINGINSDNAASHDPGHGIYVANRLGAVPYSVVIEEITGRNNQSFTTKVRKGERVVANSIAVLDSHRGVTFENCQPTLSDINIRLKNIFPSDTRAIGLKLCNVGHARTSNVVIDVSNCDAWPVKVIPTVDLDGTDPEDPQDTNPTAPEWWNVDNQLDGITMINDLAASPDKRWLVAQNQVDLILHEPTAYVTANTASDKPVVYLDNCVRPLVKRPKRRTASASNPSGSDRLVGITATTTGAKIELSRFDLDVAITNDTIGDAGTGTIVQRVDGIETATWLPVFTFDTPGNLAVTYSQQAGWIKRTGQWVTAGCRLTFDLTHTTALGVARITGAGFTTSDALGAPFENAVARHANITVTTTQLGVRLTNGVNYFTLRDNDTAGAGGILDIANFPNGATGVEISFEITFRIAE